MTKKELLSVYQIESMHLSDHNCKQAKGFARFVWLKYEKENISDFTEEYALDYLKIKEAIKVSYIYLQSLESMLINLYREMQKSAVFCDAQFSMPDKRIYPTKPLHESIKRIDRSYPLDIAKAILQSLDMAGHHKLAKASFLALYAGLRVKEVCLIEKRHFVYYLNKNQYRIEIPPNDSSCVTKGNHSRYVWIDAEHTVYILWMLEDLNDNEQLIGGNPENISKNIKYFIENTLKYDLPKNLQPMHSFRHRFARMRLEQYLPQTEQFQQMFDRMQDNKFSGYRVDKGVKPEEKEIYEGVKKAVGKVFNDLGHTSFQWGAMMTYLC